MASFLTNLKARVKTSSPRIRRETLNGREYIVVPTRLMVSGVLNGSKGPLFYPQEEINKDEGAWNGMPLVVYHPVRNGQNVSARDPDILNSQGVGFVFKANTRKGPLDAESWFDVEKTRKVDKRILDNIESGKPIEVSTGLFTTNEPAPANASHKGKPYDFIATDYRPDHLAILPDQTGACSMDDGCGVLMTNGGMGSGKAPELVPLSRDLGYETHSDKPRITKATLEKAFDSTGFVTTSSEDGEGLIIQQNSKSVAKTLIEKGWNHDSYQVKNGERTESLSKSSNRITLCGEGSRTVVYATRGHNMLTNGGPGSGPRPGGGKGSNAQKLSNKAQKLSLKAYHSRETIDHAKAAVAHEDAAKAYPKDSYDQLNHLSQAKSHDTSTYLGTRIDSVKSGRPLHNQEEESAMTQEERDAVVNTLTTNCKCQVANQYDETDRDYLESLDDKKLQKLATNRQRLIDAEVLEKTVREGLGNPKLTVNAMPAMLAAALKKKAGAKTAQPGSPAEEEAEGEPVENDMVSGNDSGAGSVSNSRTAKPLSEKEWLATAPPSIRRAVLNSQRIEAKERTSLIEKLVANIQDEDKAERMQKRYEGMDTETLQDLADTLPEPMQEPSFNQRFPQGFSYNGDIRQRQDSPRQALYAGAGAPIGNRSQLTANAEKEMKETIEAMTPPTLNYAEISKENSNRKK